MDEESTDARAAACESAGCLSVPGEAARDRGAPQEIAASLTLFGLFFLWAWLGIGPHVLHHYQSPAFLLTPGFFVRFLDTPGGPADCVSAFFSQFYYFPWAGALVLTATAWLVCLSTRALLGAFAGRRVAPWLSYAPAILLIMLDGRYDYRLLPSVALLVALGFANVYVRLRGGAWARAAAFVLLDVLLYYLSGGISVLFAVLCGLFELTRRRQVILGLACLALSPALPLAVALYSYDLSLSEAFVNLHPYRSLYTNMRLGPNEPPTLLKEVLRTLSQIHGTLMLFFPLAALTARFASPLRRAASAVGRRLRLRRRGAAATAAGEWTLGALAGFIVVGALLTWATFDVGVKRRVEVDYYASRRDWDAVLATARRMSAEAYDIYVMHEVNRGLYHTGRLPYDMCAYPQCTHPPTLLLANVEMTDLGYTKFAEWSLEIGSVNFALHWAHLAYEINGHSPRLLMLLARGHALLGRTEAAKSFLTALSRDFLRGEEARRRLRELEQGVFLEQDGECRQVRKVMLDADRGYGGFGGFSYEDMLGRYLDANPRNREAFEFLMAFYLLTGQRAKMCANLGRLDDFDYVGIPRLYEEALLLEASIHPQTPVSLRDRPISAETARRFDEFLSDLDPYQNGPEPGRAKALETLIRKWGDSYFFFAVFGFTEPRPGWKMTYSPAPGGDKK